MDRTRRAAVAATVALLLLCLPGLSAAGERTPAHRGRVLFAAVVEQNEVQAWSPAGKLLARIPAGVGPRALALWKDRLVVANRGLDRAPSSSLTIIDPDRLVPVKTRYICENCAPRDLAFDREGNLWVTAQAHRALLFLPPPWDDPAATVLVSWGWPCDLAFAADGRRLVVGFRGSDELGLVDTEEKRSVSLQLANVPEHVARRPGTDEIWATVSPRGFLAILVPRRDALDANVERVKAAVFPRGIAFSPDGKVAFVAAAGPMKILAYDADTRKVIAELPLDEEPEAIAVDPGGKYLAFSLPRRKQAGIATIGKDGSLVLQHVIDVGGRVGEFLWR